MSELDVPPSKSRTDDTGGGDIRPKRYQLAGGWGLRELSADSKYPRWAIQYMGMDWIKIEDFLPPGRSGRSSLADEIHAFAKAVGGKPIMEK